MFLSRAALRLALVLAFPVAMSSCTPTYQWVKPDAEPGSADRQQAACALDAETTYISSDESAEARASRVARWTDLCMRANGFRQQEVAP